MRESFPVCSGRLFFLLFSLFAFSLSTSCSRKTEEVPLTPPATHPLSGAYIGFGVVTVSFAHLLSEPGPAGISRAYLRRGTVVRITERRSVSGRDVPESWVLAEGNYHEGGGVSSGWIEEAMLDVFDTEARANTASRAMGP